MRANETDACMATAIQQAVPVSLIFFSAVHAVTPASLQHYEKLAKLPTCHDLDNSLRHSDALACFKVALYIVNIVAFIFAKLYCFLIICHKPSTMASLDRKEHVSRLNPAIEDPHSTIFSKCSFVRIQTRRAAHSQILSRNLQCHSEGVL